MTTSYPGAVDNLTNPTPSDTLNSATVPHAAQHANINDAMEAVQNTLGTNPQGTAASVKARLDTLEGVIDDRLPGEANSLQPTGPFPTGYVWVDATNNAIKVWNGTTFVNPSNAGGGSGLPWAVVTGGTVTTVNNPDGSVDEVHTFTGNGTLTVTQAGYAQVLVVGGGGAGTTALPGSAGIAGDMRDGYFSLPAASHAVTVGAGAILPGDTRGGPSSLGSVVVAAASAAGANAGNAPGAGATLASINAGRSSTITGTAVVYAEANQASPTPNSGDGGANNVNGAAGVVIVRVQVTPPTPPPAFTPSWAVISGGTVTEYTHPTYGVMQVHTFTGNGTLTVGTEGFAEVLLVGSGTGDLGAMLGQGGRVVTGLHTLSAGSLPVTVAAGGSGNFPVGQQSALGTIESGPIGVAATVNFDTGAGSALVDRGRDGLVSSVTGTPLAYAGAGGKAAGRPGSAAATPGATVPAGVVIVAVKKP